MSIYRVTGIEKSSGQHVAANVMAADVNQAKYLASFTLRGITVVREVKK
ncbi:MAG: hypothetical protein ACRDC6_20445 [Shewanella sp.]